MSPVAQISQLRSDTFQQTIVTAHLETALSPDSNVLYCASFQIAWNQLCDEITRAPVEVAGHSAIAAALNKRLLEKDDIAEESCLAMAGFGRDGIVERVTQGLHEKFGHGPGVPLGSIRPEDILAYAYLEKRLPFDIPFEVIEKPLRFSDGVLVQSFGVQTCYDAADQVFILDYRDPDDFILALGPSAAAGAELLEDQAFGMIIDTSLLSRPRITDQLILAKIPPRATLLETLEAVMARPNQMARALLPQWLKGELHHLHPNVGLSAQAKDSLQIPIVNLNVLHRYQELIQRPLLNPGFTDYFVAEALQGVKFKLDETGADLQSSAELQCTLGWAEPKSFTFDGPFLLYLKKPGARYPYLVLWIANSELLARASGGRRDE
jgi:hypothetical protein